MNKQPIVVMMKTGDIKPYNRNARRNDETVLKLCEIIPKVGFNQPIVIDKHNVIVKGHSRWKAAVRLGMEEIPCIISENDDETNKLDRLADNKIQEFSKWEDDILDTELASINIDDFDLSDIGFDFEMPQMSPQTPIYAPVAQGEGYSYEQSDEQPVGYEPSQPVYKPAYEPPAPDENYITDKDVQRTVPNQSSEYGAVTCPKCGTAVLYKK